MGFIHEEISNWAKPGKESLHNLIYWQQHPYVGIGSGAHGFLTDQTDIGQRYKYKDNDRLLLRVKRPDIVFDMDRGSEEWLIEYVGCAMRCRQGVDIELAQKLSAREFKPDPVVEEGLKSAALKLGGNIITLNEAEWFRETAWSLQVVLSFRK